MGGCSKSPAQEGHNGLELIQVVTSHNTVQYSSSDNTLYFTTLLRAFLTDFINDLTAPL